MFRCIGYKEGELDKTERERIDAHDRLISVADLGRRVGEDFVTNDRVFLKNDVAILLDDNISMGPFFNLKRCLDAA